MKDQVDILYLPSHVHHPPVHPHGELLVQEEEENHQEDPAKMSVEDSEDTVKEAVVLHLQIERFNAQLKESC